MLVGGPGDTLTGGKSSDTFMFAPGFGKETISNFNASHDVIETSPRYKPICTHLATTP